MKIKLSLLFLAAILPVGGLSGNGEICDARSCRTAPAGARPVRSRPDSLEREPRVSREEAELLRRAEELSGDDLDAAINTLLGGLAGDSSSALDFALGNFYLRREEPREAERFYRRALDKFGAFDRARANLARLLIREERLDEALTELKEVFLGGTARPSALTMIGYVSLLRNEPVAAETAYRQALLLDPGDDNAAAGLARALLLQERHREAAALLLNLLEESPGRSELWFLFANAQLALERPRRALSALEAARRLGSASGESLATLGDLYLAEDQPELALERYREAFSGDHPAPDRMLRSARALLLTDHPAQAGEILELIGLETENDPAAFSPAQIREFKRLQGRRFAREGELGRAEEIYRSLLDADPLDGETLLALGDTYRLQSIIDRAALCYEQASRIPGSRIEALLRLAQLEVERGRYRRAVELLEAHQAESPRPAVADYLDQVRRLALLEE